MRRLDYLQSLGIDTVEEAAWDGTITLSTHLDRSGDRVLGDLQLRPDEGVLIRLT